MARENYGPVLTLVLYYQMEPRLTIRLKLLKVGYLEGGHNNDDVRHGDRVCIMKTSLTDRCGRALLAYSSSLRHTQVESLRNDISRLN